MKRLNSFLNPISRLGNTKYSIWLALLSLITLTLLSEFYSYNIAKNPEAVGAYIIFFHVASIVYFSFRDGMKGGVISSILAVSYYFYIIYSRNYEGVRWQSSIETTIILGLVYLLLALVIGWLKQTIDILIEREANEKRRLQTIIEQLPVGVVITDNLGVITQANKRIDTILGFNLPVGFKVGEVSLLETKENGMVVDPSEGPLAQTIQTGKAVVGKEYMVKRRDGKVRYLLISSSPIYNRTGKFIAAASITNDITPQRELENRKDDFINMASHELKTPITSMKLYLETLMSRVKSSDEESVMKLLKRVKFQTEKLQELVSDLLDVSKIQTGRLTFTKETFLLSDLVREIMQEIQDSSPQHRLRLETKKKFQVYADRFRISQVLTNLLTNAVKYSPDGGVITINITNDEHKVLVSVHDNGIGIPKSQHKKIFERLYQVTDAKEKTFPGLGMGLYISKEIIRRHKGTIWVKSEKEKGATFYFTLPAALH